MNTARDIILKLLEEIPEAKMGEIIDFLEYLKHKQELDLLLDKSEEEELWNLIQNDERISAEEVNKLLEGD